MSSHAPVLRVIDDGTVDAPRSQALWHGIAAAMNGVSVPTLSFCRPAEPYVGIGYHRSLDELDLDACHRLDLPVIRRRIGGGPVYLDRDQLFFQITLPARLAPARVDRLYDLLLEPAADAFRTLGLDARRNGPNDLAVRERKISGTGAGRIGDGVTVVGNVLFRFPHERMVAVLAFAGESQRAECLRLMRRHVSSLADEGRGDVSPHDARDALTRAYARAFGREPVAGVLDAAEEEAIRRWRERFRDPVWLTGPGAPRGDVRQIKISADAWLVAGTAPGLRAEISVVGGRIERASVTAADAGDEAERNARALVGRPATEASLRRCLEPFGEPGRQVSAALAAALPPSRRSDAGREDFHSETG